MIQISKEEYHQAWKRDLILLHKHGDNEIYYVCAHCVAEFHRGSSNNRDYTVLTLIDHRDVRFVTETPQQIMEQMDKQEEVSLYGSPLVSEHEDTKRLDFIVDTKVTTCAVVVAGGYLKDGEDIRDRIDALMAEQEGRMA